MAKKNKADVQPEKKASVADQGNKGPYIPALSMEAASKRYDVNTNAEKVHRRNWLIRIVAIILGVLLLILGVGYCSMVILNKAGRFTVSLTPNEYGITLSDDKHFKNKTLNLYAAPIEDMDNITKEWILNQNGELGDDPVYEKFEDIDKVWGEHNGKNYLAYTFGLMSATRDEDESVDYRASLNLESEYKGADEAIRVAVFKNGVPTIYAKPQKGTEDKLETFAADENFLDSETIMEEVVSGLKGGSQIRYTVVVWLEGEDPQCVNEIMGGEVKLSMHFEVIGGSDKIEKT
ncbi:MAG: hypothetical protein K6F09_06445 [Clostridiales bacterium]|nr:hypothetical protein [Clostridiales bacterium]